MSIRTRIGLLVPSTNTTCEPDFHRAVPPGLTVHTHRMWLTEGYEDPEGMDRMNDDVEKGARYLRTAGVDLIAYACTKGSFYSGPGHDQELIDRIQAAAGVPAVATSPAAAEALRFLGSRCVSVATPYKDWANQRLRSYYIALGFDVLNVDGEPVAAVAGRKGINDQDPESVLAFAPGVCRPEAEALFCSCTAWRAFEVVEELERRVGRPVVTSNQATVCAALKRLGVPGPASGFGSLFSKTAR